MNHYKKYMQFIGKSGPKSLPNIYGEEYYDPSGASGVIKTEVNVAGWTEPHCYIEYKGKLFHAYISVYDPYYPDPPVDRTFIIEEYSKHFPRSNFKYITVETAGLDFFKDMLYSYNGSWKEFANRINKYNKHKKIKKVFKNKFDPKLRYFVLLNQNIADVDKVIILETNDIKLADACSSFINKKYSSVNWSSTVEFGTQKVQCLTQKRYELWNIFSDFARKNPYVISKIQDAMESQKLTHHIIYI